MPCNQNLKKEVLTLIHIFLAGYHRSEFYSFHLFTKHPLTPPPLSSFFNLHTHPPSSVPHPNFFSLTKFLSTAPLVTWRRRRGRMAAVECGAGQTGRSPVLMADFRETRWMIGNKKAFQGPKMHRKGYVRRTNGQKVFENWVFCIYI